MATAITLGCPTASSAPIPHPAPAIVVPGATTATSHTSASITSQTASSHCRQPPQVGLAIPNLPLRLPDGTKRHRRDSWWDIITHWLVGDPERNLDVPLKDWPPDWYRGLNRPLTSKYGQRATATLEFIEVFQSNEPRFLAAYPEAEEGHSWLLHAIKAARRECQAFSSSISRSAFRPLCPSCLRSDIDPSTIGSTTTRYYTHVVLVTTPH
ncbi:hypothetical protein SCLCIDRAFT_1012518 [Scleroderma citrinum Foug A]|uniref:Uncharacterized protein n=1 Tax=Scleroderma citrinum Foug A TaxID=1036808 RepID=A0A0C3ATE1_9AGAM|nr:hypothetical protein SCLCIDRAFT_1012518 [Scleroderma citrinum Foug A]